MNRRATRARRGQSGSARKAELERRRRVRRRWITFGLPAGAVAVILVVAIVLSTSGGGGKASAAGQVTTSGSPHAAALAVGDAIPEFSAPALAGGGKVSWSAYRGAPAVLVGWAPWCPHCQKELPVLGQVLKDYPGVRVVSMVTAIGLHPGPAPADFMDQHALSFPVAVDDAQGTLAAALGVSSFPTVYYVGPDGTIRDVVVGEDTEAGMRSRFQALAQLAAA